ncbi:hypothetical protein WN51_10597 [Melipona quadrifasciata]|uniref:Uncharacterized protein n=1 Tax=Melipona quadrifasciata TaxID=166423 RepID=A0A0M9A5S4_9HYME|nr:hypothetical protein WN51_10597 [Melipona quadrifasciata]
MYSYGTLLLNSSFLSEFPSLDSDVQHLRGGFGLQYTNSGSMSHPHKLRHDQLMNIVEDQKSIQSRISLLTSDVQLTVLTRPNLVRKSTLEISGARGNFLKLVLKTRTLRSEACKTHVMYIASHNYWSDVTLPIWTDVYMKRENRKEKGKDRIMIVTDYILKCEASILITVLANDLDE